MKVIERNGKYYVQCMDGEVEITEQEMKARNDLASYFEDVSKVMDKYDSNTENQEMLFIIAQIDVACNEMNKAFQSFLDENGKDTAREIVLLTLNSLIKGINEDLKNPLKKNKLEINQYRKAKYEGMHSLWVDVLNYNSKDNIDLSSDSKKSDGKNANEKYPQIKVLFNFIEYLHSNIKNFNQYSGLINELEQLDKERKELKPRNNYKDKRQYDKIQKVLEGKFKILQDNTANLIKAKAEEINLCNFNNEPNYSFNGVEAEIHHLKENFKDEDLAEIFKYKRKYFEYRIETHKTFLSLQFFFDELDEIANSIFDYFKKKEKGNDEAELVKSTLSNNNSKKAGTTISCFQDIFIDSDWKKYIEALSKTEPPIIDGKFKFIGKPRPHKGVVCSWIKHLQTKGKITLNVNRSQLASVLNEELKDFNLGKDGKTFDNVSNEFDNKFKDQLIKLTN